MDNLELKIHTETKLQKNDCDRRADVWVGGLVKVKPGWRDNPKNVFKKN
jgi:hypothetical protein